jgi:ZIP family zinc transporter
VLEAGLWGLFGASSLLIGALIALRFRLGNRELGAIMAFGAGALISAASFELIGESVSEGDMRSIVVGMLGGSIVYFGGDIYIDRLGGEHRAKVEPPEQEGGELGIVLGAVLDGIPESFVLGTSFAGGGSASVALVAAVFISNMPESIASSAGLKRSGWSTLSIILMWTAIVIVCTVSSVLGYVIFDRTDRGSGALIQAFAAGAILTMLAQTMMPEAFKHGGRLVGVITVLGFITALSLTLAE